MLHEILPVGMLRCNCSIFGEETTKEAIVIDPGADISEIAAILTKHGLQCKAIVVTHAHIDHIGGAQKLKASTGAPVYLNANDQDLNAHMGLQAAWLGLPPPEQTEVDTEARDGDILRLGATQIHVLHTPGHTQGSICLWIPSERKLVAGDTLFRESVGRTDLPGGDEKQLLSSIHTKVLTLPDETEVYPGHGLPTTIGHEREHNPFL